MINLNSVTLLFVDGTGQSFYENENVIKLMKKICNFKEIKHLTCLPYASSSESEVIKIDQLNYSEYNRFCIWNLNSYVNTDYVFLMQYDGFIVNPNLFTDEFLKYDYIGAPWCSNLFAPSLGCHPAYVGNGGFCIRSKKLLNLCSNLSKDISLPCNEDCFIGIHLKNYLETEFCSFAPYELAKLFAVETVCEENHCLENSFGFHGKDHIQRAHNLLKKHL